MRRMNAKFCTATLLALLCLVGCASNHPVDQRLLVCGADEVFIIDAAQSPPAKQWSWKAAAHADLPENVRTLFRSTDDCKPRGDRVLISSSGGACAIVERATGRVLWYARVPNAHSIELLPGNRVIAAASTHAQGNRLMLFNLDKPDSVIWEAPLVSAHGVVWDDKRQRLWALGLKELRCYALENWSSDRPSLSLEREYPLPDNNGHDLHPVPASDDLLVSTGRHVFLFNRESGAFRPHPDIPDQAHVKSVNIHPQSRRLAYTQGHDEHWWTDTVHLLHPQGQVQLPGQRLYKVRWLAAE